MAYLLCVWFAWRIARRLAPGAKCCLGHLRDPRRWLALIELAEAEPVVMWICKRERWLEVQRRIGAMSYRAIPLGTPYQRRVMFRVEPVTAVR